jgi:NAD(P)-dependent dehydrogenase (short-subunit alcohol dehydrogenase family)
MFRLDGRVAVVTGASSGLGVGFAVALAQAGADLVLAARRRDGLEATAAQVRATGRDALVVEADVADPDAARSVADAAVARFGRIDVLVNNAGVATAVPASRETPDAFRRVVDVNLHGAYWMAQAVAGAMPRGSSIVNVSSIIALRGAGLPQAAYAASKAGLLGLTRDLAQQWTGRRGIRVNALLPGLFRSEIWDDHEPGYIDELLRRVPAGRPGELEELAATVVFLAAPASGYVSGSTIVVDGGATVA